jgi:stage V sporulation protein AE
MIFLQAFLASGLICLVGQILMVNTKVGFVRLFIGAVAAGVVLTAAGWIGPIVQFGFAGVIISVMDAGEALYGGFLSALGGNGTGIIAFWVMLLGIFLAAIVLGCAKSLRGRETEPARPIESTTEVL